MDLIINPRKVRPVSFGLFKFLRDFQGKSNRGLLRGDVTDDEVIDAIMRAPDHFTDLSITVANIIPAAGYNATRLAAAVAITQGQSLYEDNSVPPSVWRLADANASATTAGGSSSVAIALTPALTGQPCFGMTTGSLAFGAILTKGIRYVISANAGGIAPDADLASGWYRTDLGYGLSTTVLQMNIVITGLALA
jgi:hypothetical protein